MIITELIREQVFQCAVMLGAGIIIMIAHQVFTGICRLSGMGKVPAASGEIVFWMIAAVITWQFLYYCAYGRISFHSAAAFASGALLWKCFFYGIIDRIFMRLDMKQGKHNRYGEKETQQPVQGHQSGDRH